MVGQGPPDGSKIAYSSDVLRTALRLTVSYSGVGLRTDRTLKAA
jgi:hypothetical protein